MLLMREMHRVRVSRPSGGAMTAHVHTWEVHRMTRVGNAGAHRSRRRPLVFVAHPPFTPIDCADSARASITIILRLAALARVIGPSFVNIGREDARKVFFELLCLCEIELL